MLNIPLIEISHGGSGERFSVGNVSLGMICGLGLHQAWMFAVLFAPEKTFAGDTDIESYLVGLYFTVSLVAFVFNLFLQAILGRWTKQWFLSRRTIVLATALLALSSATTFFGTFETTIGTACFCFSALTSGVASSTLILLWGHLFSDGDIPSLVINTAFAFAFGIIAFSLILNVLPGTLSTPSTVLINIAEGILLFCTFSSRSSNEGLSSVPLSSPIRPRSFAWRVCPPMFFLGIATGLFGQSLLSTVLTGADPADRIIVIAATGLTVFIIVLRLVFSRSQSLLFLYRPLMPMAAISMLLIPQLHLNESLTYLALIMGYLCLEALLWITTGELCAYYRVSPLLAFGLMRGSLSLGTLLIDAVQRSYMLMTSTDLGLTDFSIVSISLVALMCGYVLLPREQNQSTIEATSRDRQDKEENAADAHSSEHAGEENDSSAKTSQRKPGRFVRRCQAVADKYLLTKKETEILFLLAKGNNAAAIQEQLFISENTVRTHMRHIYRKLDVHTQQEIINLVNHSIVRDDFKK